MLNFINKNQDKITWFSNLQKMLFSYLNSDLRDLTFSNIYKPVMFTLFIAYNQNFERNVLSQLTYVRAEYHRLFSTDLEREEGLFILFFVLFEAADKDKINMEQVNLMLKSKWSQSIDIKIIGLPINNKSPNDQITTEFKFQKHIFLKNKIHTYFSGDNLQISSINIKNSDRCQKLNFNDIDGFRDSIRKNIYTYFIPFYEKKMNLLLSQNLETRNAKKKSVWSFFTNESTKTKGNPNDFSTQEKTQFNVAENFFVIGNYELAAAEFKSLAHSFAVI